MADLNRILEIERQCFNRHDLFSRRTFRRLLHNPFDSVIFDVLELDRMLIGYALYLTRRNSKRIRLYSLGIETAFAGQGLAGLYLQERLQDFAQDFAQIVLEVRLSNQRATGLYVHLGFEVKQILQGYYSDGEDACRMVKELRGIRGIGACRTDA
jgi:ribosomal-protein-alanine N-acetyltransferase